MRLRSLVVALFSTTMLMTVACGSPPKYNVPVDSPFLPYEPPEVADQGDDGDDDPEIPDDAPAEDDDDDTSAPAPTTPAAGGNTKAK